MRHLAMARCALLLMAAALPLAGTATADDITVPIALQLELLGHVVRFERNYGAHAAELARVVIAAKDGAASVRAAAQVSAEIVERGNLGGRPASAIVAQFETTAELREAAHAAAIVCVMPGFTRDELEEIADAFEGSGVITVGVSAGDVAKGLALGFELESGRPRIVVNLTRARAQRLDFNAQLLRLARVVQ